MWDSSTNRTLTLRDFLFYTRLTQIFSESLFGHHFSTATATTTAAVYDSSSKRSNAKRLHQAGDFTVFPNYVFMDPTVQPYDGSDVNYQKGIFPQNAKLRFF